MVISAVLGMLSASAFTPPTYPANNGSTFPYGNSAVNAPGKSTYAAVTNHGGIPYRFFVPVSYTTGGSVKYPVIFFLHGIGEAGTDDDKQMNAGGGTANGATGLVASANPPNQTANPCFLVLPQSASGYFGPSNIPDFQNIINTLITQYPNAVDTSRISLTGLSAGAGSTWDVMEWIGGIYGGTGLYVPPGNSMFSCGAPVSGLTSTEYELQPQIPIWCGVAADDASNFGVGGTERPVAGVRNHGIPVIYTKYFSGGHSATTWSAFYENPLLISWMLAQKVGLPEQGIMNLFLTNASQGTTLNLSGLANSSAGWTRVGWTSSTIDPNAVHAFSYTVSGNTVTTTDSAFASITATSGHRLGFINTTTGGIIVYDVIGINNTGTPPTYTVTLSGNDIYSSSSTGLIYPPGTYLTNPRVGTGTAPNWSLSGIPLNYGNNTIQVMAEMPSNGFNNSNLASLGGYTTVNLPYGTNYNSSGISATPSIGITTPTIVNSAYTVSSGAGSLNFSGTAGPASGSSLSKILWTSNLGYSGTATGTTSWSVSGVPLVVGSNIITFYALDNNANTSSVSVNVTYTGTSPANQAPQVLAYQPALDEYINANMTNPYPAYRTINWSGSSVMTTMTGTVTDDGLPTGSSVTYTWNLASGPAAVSWGSQHSLTTTVTFSKIGTYVLRLDASDTALTGSNYATVTVLPTGSVAKAIDCGSTTSYTASDSTVYAADSGFTTTGVNYSSTAVGVYGNNAPSPDAALYQKMRMANSSAGLVYNVPITTNGTYDVVLKFIEPGPIYLPGQRVFNVSAQGTQVATLDVFNAIQDLQVSYDDNAAYDYVIPGVSVTANNLNITLSNVSGEAVLSAILVRTASGGGGTAPSITGSAPGGIVGTAYSYTYTVSGSPTPTCTVTSGSLPAGLTLSTGGTISGVPTTPGTSTGVITANNGISPSATKNFSILITKAPSITGTAPGGTVGTAYSYSYTVSGSPTPTCTVTSGSLPAGLTLSTSGTISGTPTTPGTSTGVITAANGVIPAATKSFSIAINTALEVRFNFEPTGSPSSPGGNWNTVFGLTSGTSTTSKNYNTGASTGVVVNASSFTYSQAYGKVSTALYPSPIQSNSFAKGSGTASGTVVVSGLDHTKAYSVTVFGSDTGGSPTAHSTYTIGSTVLNYVNANNTTTTAVFSSVTPDTSGNITMSVNAGTDHIGSLGALIIHQN